MDWSLCVICQDASDTELSCPQNRQTLDAHTVYTNFFENVEHFKKLDALPVVLHFGEQGTPECFLSNKASWHRPCHQKFNRSKLERVIIKKRKQELEETQSASDELRRSKRQSTGSSSNICIFCEQTGPHKLHEYATQSAEQGLRQMAHDMQDTKLLAHLSGGDLVAIEAKYHLECLTTYRNRYRVYNCHRSSSSTSQGSTIDKVSMGKARAFVELVGHIEASVEDGTYIFNLFDLHLKYEERLNALGIDISINKTRLKERLLTHFGDMELQEQHVGKTIILVFPEGMQQLLKDAFLVRDYDNEAFLFAKVAKICREEIFKEANLKFSGSFQAGCQENMTPNTKLLLSMILYGPNMSGSVNDSQACLTLAQIIVHNCKQKADPKTVHSRHSLDREPPLPLYIGMNIHTLTRSRTVVDQMAKLGISSSYERVMQVENSLANSMCEQFKADGVVCPSNLRKGLFTVGALDNLDYNPSSMTAQGSFHGTSISIIQHPTQENHGIERAPLMFQTANAKQKPQLPDAFAIVPAVYMKPSATSVPAAATEEITGQLQAAKAKEQCWIQHAVKLLQEDILTKGQMVSWAGYHASCQQPPLDPPAITALLPLFMEKADSPAMVKHGMSIVKDTTAFLNPGQIPVLACDCPIFAMCKYTQWKYPMTLGEDKFIVMFGGLHLEKALWTALGDFLDASGWTTALTEASVATAGTADSFIKASHITRTRHAHQVTALALSSLQGDAFKLEEDPLGEEHYEEWRLNMLKKSPTFQYWDMVLKTEILILIFIRSHREKDFLLYVQCLEALMFLFFALDHYNYSRWASVHLRDMKALPPAVKEDFQKHWVVAKSSRRFSALPIDQTHEQENARVKGKGGAIGLTENPTAFRRWMISGPEQARLMTSFEREYLTEDDLEINYHHHEEGFSAQQSFHHQVRDLIKVIEGYGNPFQVECPELLILHTRDCATEAAVSTVRTIEAVGTGQYQKFMKEVLEDRTKSIHDPIKKNNLSLLKTRKPKVNSKVKQLAVIRDNVSLFGRLYIANQQRDGDIDVFFSHENQLYPPSLSDYGKLRKGTKSDLVKCLDSSGQNEHPETFDCTIFDGAVLVHTLPPTGASTFKDYAEKIFIPFLQREIQHGTSRIDVIWDKYISHSLKESTREKRGSGVRVKVSPQTKIPVKWKDFLCDSRNKEELFAYLTQMVEHHDWPDHKDVYITKGSSVVSKGRGQTMSECIHEEADTRIVVHLLHALQQGNMKVKVRTVDTDILVILIGQFFSLHRLCSEIDLWVAFGVGKDYCHYNINTLFHNLGNTMSRSLPVFHAFSGCDTTSSFFRKGKKLAWQAWKSYPNVTNAFLSIAENPYQEVGENTHQFKEIERLTVVMYDRTSTIDCVNEARKNLFSKKSKSLENIPPTKVIIILKLITRNDTIFVVTGITISIYYLCYILCLTIFGISCICFRVAILLVDMINEPMVCFSIAIFPLGCADTTC